MKYINLQLYNNKDAIKIFSEERGVPEIIHNNYPHPKEDYYLISMDKPIFVVADGVTLDIKKLSKMGITYPDPSPAGDVARIFCEKVVEYLNSHYNDLSNISLKGAFDFANKAVWEYNSKIGKSEYCGEDNETGYYSATGAFAVIKDKIIYWARICDSYIALFDKDMKKKFITNGLCTPYAVINGEEKMSKYLEAGLSDIEEGDILFVFTDGFDKHFADKRFIRLFTKWDEKLQKRLLNFTIKAGEKDPKNFGHERTLIAVRCG